ncbi:MAG: hypothetical protein DWQ06_09800 [Calditrichaeota bacterium]|nr:MAG: hypothetical protein DWQ06_09800 [Calditrichota bacterium]
MISPKIKFTFGFCNLIGVSVYIFSSLLIYLSITNLGGNRFPENISFISNIISFVLILPFLISQNPFRNLLWSSITWILLLLIILQSVFINLNAPDDIPIFISFFGAGFGILSLIFSCIKREIFEIKSLLSFLGLLAFTLLCGHTITCIPHFTIERFSLISSIERFFSIFCFGLIFFTSSIILFWKSKVAPNLKSSKTKQNLPIYIGLMIPLNLQAVVLFSGTNLVTYINLVCFLFGGFYYGILNLKDENE